MPVLENCEPKRVFHYFEEICKIPHGSGNTKQISDFLVNFAKDHGFKYVQDEMNNVIIYKPGIPVFYPRSDRRRYDKICSDGG